MFAFLPLLFFLSISLIIRKYFKTGRRASLLMAGCLSGVLITAITETLSLFNCLSFYPVLGIWSALSITAFSFCLPLLKTVKLRPSGPRFSRDEKILFALTGVTLAITGLTAVMSVANSWDSMTYHLPRVEHWIQNKTVAYYPTNIIRQLYYCPWAEYAVTQLWILRAPESSANGIQWMAMLGSMTAVSLIARQWGASRRGQLLACLAAVTLPIGIVQSVCTQTDYAAAFWIVCFVYFLIELRGRHRKLYVLAAGLSFGLALLTKGYSYIFIMPFLAWFIYGIFKSRDLKRLREVLAISVLALSLNCGFYLRNVQTFHTVTGGSKIDLVNASFDHKVLLENLLRNACAHLGTPSEKINHWLEKAVFNISNVLGIDLNDPRATFYDRPFAMISMTQEENSTGNLIHFLGFALILILFCVRPRNNGGLRTYLLLTCLAAVLFCWIVRWQPWISRFHLALFLLFCPACGILVERIPKKSTLFLGVLLFTGALPWLFLNWEHPWFGPTNIWTQPAMDQYFRKKETIEYSYKMAASRVAALGCRQVGIILNVNTWEHPLWALLKGDQPVYDGRIEHVLIDNESKQLNYPLGNFTPCAVISLEEEPVDLALSNVSYKKIWSFQDKEGFKSAVYTPVN